MSDIAKILRDAGLIVAVGEPAVRRMIAIAADENNQTLCSGYRVFPGGERCHGCSDCDKKKVQQ